MILTDCPEASLEFGALFAALRLELEHDGAISVAAVSTLRSEISASIEITIPCSPQAASVRIRVRSAKGARADRNMTLSDLPRSLRARAVALAAAELARSSWLRSEPSTESDASDSAPPAGAGPAPAKTAGGAKTADGATSAATRFATASDPPNSSPAPPVLARPEARGASFVMAVGPTVRFFLPATTPAYGARASVRFNRFHAGSDFVAQFPGSFGRLALGVATIWAAWDVLFHERPRFRAGVGPRIALGVAWSPTYPRNMTGVLSAAGDTYDVSEDPEQAQGGRTAFYAEGSFAANAFIKLGRGLTCGAILEAGVAWGAAATGQSEAVAADTSAGATIGGSLVLGYAL